VVVVRRRRRGPLLSCRVLFLAEVVEVEVVARGVEGRSTWLCCCVVGLRIERCCIMESAKVLVMFGFACEGGRSTFAMRDQA
jgi:hypothetical protein